jgi:hypothetical protein
MPCSSPAARTCAVPVTPKPKTSCTSTIKGYLSDFTQRQIDEFLFWYNPFNDRLSSVKEFLVLLKNSFTDMAQVWLLKDFLQSIIRKKGAPFCHSPTFKHREYRPHDFTANLVSARQRGQRCEEQFEFSAAKPIGRPYVTARCTQRSYAQLQKRVQSSGVGARLRRYFQSS